MRRFEIDQFMLHVFVKKSIVRFEFEIKNARSLNFNSLIKITNRNHVIQLIYSKFSTKIMSFAF